jgi:hypothetical protein
MKLKYGRTLEYLSRAVASKKFTWFIVSLFVVEALWIALSFRFPMIYDEVAHFGFIKSYSTQISPYTENTPGNMTVQVSLFHYLLSFIYRGVHLFTDNVAVQVILLRLLNIAMFTAGLLLTRKLLQKINIADAYSNVALLIFILLPITPFVAATINYDNLLFPLTVLYMLLAVRILKAPLALNWQTLLTLVTVGCVAALVKYTFLPVFAASVIFMTAYYLIGNRKILSKLGRFSRSTNLTTRSYLLITTAIIAVGLFSVTYVRNVVIYGSVKPSCMELLSKKECLSNGIIARNDKAKKTADQRPAEPLNKFMAIWTNNMITMTGLSGNSTTDGSFVLRKPLPIMKEAIFFASLIGVGILFYAWRMLKKDINWHFLLAMCIALVLAVLIVNAKSYYSLHTAYANQPRYLLSLLPIFIAMIVVAMGKILKNRREMKLIILFIFIVIFSQGGGAITHIVRSEDSWYWQNDIVVNANHMAKKILQPIVKE